MKHDGQKQIKTTSTSLKNEVAAARSILQAGKITMLRDKKTDCLTTRTTFTGILLVELHMPLKYGLIARGHVRAADQRGR